MDVSIIEEVKKKSEGRRGALEWVSGGIWIGAVKWGLTEMVTS